MRAPRVPVIKLALAVLWAVPWCMLALLCMITIVLGPLGILFWMLGCWPYQHIWKMYYDQKYAYENRDRPLEGEEADVPWET